ncbi:MAG: ATP-binding cassette domain-containing protein [Vicinamibacterales bacterium]
MVQTSTMDCGPASLKCLLEGHRIRVSYGRLREACQTGVDGTSIDVIEVVANELGLRAEQVQIPVDHVLLGRANLPALVVVRHADGPTHFVVVWQRIGAWLQVMDPAVGRRWVSCRRFVQEIVRHTTSVRATDWRAWAGTDDFLDPLRTRLSRLGANTRARSALVADALADDGWFSVGALDAGTRVATALVESGALAPGREAVRLLSALVKRTRESPLDIYRLIAPVYWSVAPDAANTDPSHERLVYGGAVLLRVSGRSARRTGFIRGTEDGTPRLSPELAAALSEAPVHPLRSLWSLLRTDGLLRPAAVAVAVLIAVGIAMIEAVLFRGIFDIGRYLPIGSQRLAAVAAFLAFMALAMTFRLPIVSESFRMGRRLDARLRMAILRKLPRLSDRYFQSRPISDLADRSHNIQMTRLLPGIGFHCLQSAGELVLTLVGIFLIDPPSIGLASAIAFLSIVMPATFQPVINERDLRVRNHAGALGRFYLDALLGLVPIRTHRAEAAVRHQHQSLLVEWVRSTRRVIRVSLCASGLQALCGTGLAGLLLVAHFVRSAGVTGADLLLVFWTLKLPEIGQTLMGLAHQYPAQRNVLLRLLEPLSAPEQGTSSTPSPTGASAVFPNIRQAPEWALATKASTGGVEITIRGGTVVAAGHTILRDVNLDIASGEQVAIVGLSGAGKSTLLGLLLGWHRLADGVLLVDGAPLTDDALGALRQRTAWVDPAVQIWNQPFFDNLAYSSRQVDPVRTAAAINAANLRGVLRKLPQGFQTALGEGGARLSGGEGQRVRLARALAQPDVSLALLDEPFRGLDRDQRSALLAHCCRHWKDATLLCVTHDISETLSFGRVLVVEGGRIVEDDHPARLAERPSRYRALLEAEYRVRARMWSDDRWHRVRVEGGTVSQDGEPHGGRAHDGYRAELTGAP